ncbi:MAG: hypothetical protein JO354_09180 [Verrucomicrobia bacterium]|nr:hypothetical protein [Verrucomicrobiota bacterium]
MNGTASIDDPVLPTRRRRFRWGRFGGGFLLVSIIVHVVFIGGATVFVVQRYEAARKLTFKGGPPSPNPSTRAIEHKVQLAKKQSTMSVPSMAKRITTTGLAKIALPDMPAMPKLASAPTKMAGAAGADVSFNPGLNIAAGGAISGGAPVPFFGFKESRGGGALVGRLFDLKQLANGTPSKLEQDHAYPAEIANFVKAGMNDTYLSKYFAGPKPLYTTQVFIPKIPSDQGPGAFGLAERVQPKMWIVHYKGTVIPPESGTFRFVGVCDDILVVRFNGMVVLDCGSMTPSGRAPQKFYNSDGLQLKKDMAWYKGLGRGEPFQVNAGQSYPLDILIGEWPGGDFKAFLLIEKDGVSYDKDSKGNPILPIFKVAAGETTRGGTEAPVFAKTGPVWKAEQPAETAGAK